MNKDFLERIKCNTGNRIDDVASYPFGADELLLNLELSQMEQEENKIEKEIVE